MNFFQLLRIGKNSVCHLVPPYSVRYLNFNKIRTEIVKQCTYRSKWAQSNWFEIRFLTEPEISQTFLWLCSETGISALTVLIIFSQVPWYLIVLKVLQPGVKWMYHNIGFHLKSCNFPASMVSERNRIKLKEVTRLYTKISSIVKLTRRVQTLVKGFIDARVCALFWGPKHFVLL